MLLYYRHCSYRAITRHLLNIWCERAKVLPDYVQREFEAYLKCGRLEQVERDAENSYLITDVVPAALVPPCSSYPKRLLQPNHSLRLHRSMCLEFIKMKSANTGPPYSVRSARIFSVSYGRPSVTVILWMAKYAVFQRAPLR